jgi:hypothetical protein
VRNKPKARKLPKNKKTRFPQYFCFVDTETIPTKVSENKTIHKLRLGVAIFVRFRSDMATPNVTVVNFIDREDFWNAVNNFVKGHNTLHIIAHNALFDMVVLRFEPYLTSMGFECRFIFEQGVTFISKWRNDKRGIMILDNSNWFAGKLEKWGDKLNVPKMEMPDFKASDKDWFEYCYRDTEILYKLQLWLIDFIKSNDLGNWKYTLAGLSFNAYRHRFMSHPIYIPEETRETYLARQSYKGGRTECFYSGHFEGEEFYKLDINSMYPFVMMINEYPTNVEGYVRKPTIDSVEKGLKKYCAIAKCRVNITTPYFPIKYNDRTVYPIGTFTSYLSTPEIRLAINKGWIKEIEEIAWYRKRNIFKDFVEFFYTERMKWAKEGDELRSYMFKIFLNSLYGKFGQRKYDDKVIGFQEPGTYEPSYYYDSVTNTRGITRQLGANIILSTVGGEGYNSFCAIASHVTAYARIYLYSIIVKAKRDNVWYCDTDSIITNGTGYSNVVDVIDNKRIGSLKVEGIANNVEIISPKHYKFGDSLTLKGVSKNAKRTKEGGYIQEMWPGLNKILKVKSSNYFNYVIVKHLRSSVQSGNISPTGKVYPFILDT